MGPEKAPRLGSTESSKLNGDTRVPNLGGFCAAPPGQTDAIFCLPIPSGYRPATFLPLRSTDLRAPGGLSCP